MRDQGLPSEPIDVGAVRRDEEFLNALVEGRTPAIADRADHELATLLSGWRTDSISGPIPTVPTVADIEAVIARANERERRGGLSRRLRIVSGAAAILAIAGAGLLVLSENSQPGDPLWNVKQVVFAEQAEQTQARINVQENINAAAEALEDGDSDKMSQLLQRAEEEMGPLRDKGQIADLRELIASVKDRAPSKPSTSTSAPSSSETPGETGTDPVDPTETDSSSPSSNPSKPSSSTKTSTRPSESSKPKPKPTSASASTSVTVSMSTLID